MTGQYWKEVQMKCFKCGKETDLLTVNDVPICSDCVEQERFVVCSDKGKVIADKSFHCDYICSDCVWKE